MSRSVRLERQAGNDEALGFVVINSEASATAVPGI